LLHHLNQGGYKGVPKPKRNTSTNLKLEKRTGQTGKKRLSTAVIASILLVIIILSIIAVSAYWFRDSIAGTALNIIRIFGFGLIIIAIAIVITIQMIRRKHLIELFKQWNYYLGGILLVLAIWGALSLFAFNRGILSRVTLGGTFGQIILGSPDVIGGIRLVAIAMLAIIFIIPRRVWSILKKITTSMGCLISKFTKEPRSKVSEFRSRIEPADSQLALYQPETTVSQKAEEIAKTLNPPVKQSLEHNESTLWQSQREPILTSGGWQLPPIDILEKPKEVELNKDDINKRARLIEEALASYGVEAKVGQINVGPTVTQFGIEPGWDRKYKKVMDDGQDRLEEVSKTRIRVERITSLSNDLALALAAPSIRIEAPVPGKSVVGIEVPNTTFGSVSLRSVIESMAFQKIKARSKLAIAMGKGAGGESISADLARMPHLLIAGATGSGKTICLDSIICCLLLHSSPDDIRFIMVDPKRVELIIFNGIPHLVAPVIVESDKAVKALRWLNQEMDNRYRLFAKAGARNIEAYNKDRSQGESMPYLILIIDELADLMMTAFDEVERTLCRLAQLARATGIHLIVATQRPSVDVVTGLIKANFPSRISFAVTSQVDSRTILDAVGAEKLLGRGDMLYMTSESGRPKRLQGSFISDSEIQRTVYFWGNQGNIDTNLINFDEMEEPITLSQKIASGPDPLLTEVKHLAQQHQYISASFLQRRLHIGYPRAARLIDALEKEEQDKNARPESLSKSNPTSNPDEDHR
jgi:DNA segregation ATPase FtsK/SpoIIIE, S-DNA-T family